jgi:type IV pilus assembly protein PilN
MRRINLLPSDERGRPADRLRRGVLGILLIVSAFVVILMVGIYLVLLLRLNDLEEQVAKLDDEIAQQNAHLAELSPYRDLQARLEDKKPVADGIFASRFTWDQFFQGLAFVVPEATALDTLTAKAAPVDLDAPAEEPLDPPGTVTFTGIALPRYENVADFVVRMDNLQYLANADLDRAALGRFEEPATGKAVSTAQRLSLKEDPRMSSRAIGGRCAPVRLPTRNACAVRPTKGTPNERDRDADEP